MSDTPAVKLAPGDREEMQRLIRWPNAPTSNRDRDRARTRLKERGLIRFDRKAWKWEVLPAGRALLDALKEEGEGREA